MADPLIISGSPTPDARCGLLVTHLRRALGAEVLAVRDLPTVALLTADATDPAVAAAIARVASSAGVVVASPVRRASYSALVKSLVDLLPPGTLAGRPVLPVVTGNSRAALDLTLRPMLRGLGATDVLPGIFVPDLSISARGVDHPPLTAALTTFTAALRPAA